MRNQALSEKRHNFKTVQQQKNFEPVNQSPSDTVQGRRQVTKKTKKKSTD